MYPYGNPPKKSTPQHPQQPTYRSGSYVNAPAAQGFQGAYPSQQQYPQQQSYRGTQSYGTPGYQQPTSGYPQQPSSPYPAQSGQYPSSGYPSQPAKYPAPVSYPQQAQGSYAAQQRSGYSPQPAGYPPQSQPGYSPQQPQQSLSYRPPQSQLGYPPQQPQQSFSYRPPQSQLGYPTQQPQQSLGYPPQQVQVGYPLQQQQQSVGYPPQSVSPPQQVSAPPQQPQQSGYPAPTASPPQQVQAGYPPQHPQQSLGYPPQQVQPGYPPQQQQQSTSPPQQVSVPPQQPQQSSYLAPTSSPPQQVQAGYPPQQQQPSLGYPPQLANPPQQVSAPPQQPQPTASPPQQVQSSPSPQPPEVQHEEQPTADSAPVLSTETPVEGTVHPAEKFSANADAEALRKAMKGLGCDSKAVLNILCYRSNAQRQKIRMMFKTMYGKDLIKELISELRGNFEDLIVALLYLPEEFDARELHHAMAGAGTTESTLIEIMVTRTNAEINAIKECYRQLYNKDLEQALASETSGHFKRLLVSLSAGGRDESTDTDPARAAAQAQELYQAGEKRWGTDEPVFNATIVANNPAQLRLIFDEYMKLSGHDIEKAIKKEFSGDVEDGLAGVVKSVKNKPAYFAERAYKSMKGLGTNDRALIRVIVSRCEKDMVQIKEEYQRMYKTTLESDIIGDTSGKYKEGLLALVRGNR